MAKPDGPWRRFGIYEGNDNEAEWPRSLYLPEAAIAGLITALKQVLANPTPHDTTVRAVIGTHIGQSWKDESNEWVRRTLDTLVQEFTGAEIAAIEAAFPL